MKEDEKSLEFNNLDTLESYWKLQQLYRQDLWYSPPEAREIENRRIDAGGGLTYYYGAKLLSEKILETLGDLAEEQQLIPNTGCSSPEKE